MKKRGSIYLNTYKCTDGLKVGQKTIDRKYSNMLRQKHEGHPTTRCEGCGGQAQDNSHIISRRRCKEMGRADLIWDQRNVCSYCRDCHHKWENYKSGEWKRLRNYPIVVRWLKDNDFETLVKMLNLTEDNESK